MGLIKKLFRKRKISKSEQNELLRIQNLFPEIMSFQEMMDKIKNGASLCRYGDAEFDIGLARNANDPYQRPSERLSQRLIEILKTPSDDKLIVSIPPFNHEHNNIKNFYRNISFWEWYWLDRWERLSPLFVNKSYGNSFFSRDAVFYEIPVEDIISIWKGKNVVFVVPENGRFIYDSRLFDCVKSYNQIEVSPTHAFDNYDNVLKEALKYPKDYLFFVCAGPTACVLAFDLAREGYQALDMGHFPNCYLEFLKEAPRPEAFPMIKKASL